MADLEKLAKNLKSWRKLRKLSMRQLADSAGVNKDLISKLENKKVPGPRLTSIEKIANALKCNLHDLI